MPAGKWGSRDRRTAAGTMFGDPPAYAAKAFRAVCGNLREAPPENAHWNLKHRNECEVNGNAL